MLYICVNIIYQSFRNYLKYILFVILIFLNLIYIVAMHNIKYL